MGEVSPVPQTCWSPTVAERAKAEAEALAKLDAASMQDSDDKDLGPETPTAEETLTPELKAEDNQAEKKFDAAKSKGKIPPELESTPEEDTEIQKEESAEDDGGSTRCADEGEKCACRGTVYFGKKYTDDGAEETTLITLKKFPFVSKLESQSIMCTVDAMGEDPDEDNPKVCFCVEET